MYTLVGLGESETGGLYEEGRSFGRTFLFDELDEVCGASRLRGRGGSMERVDVLAREGKGRPVREVGVVVYFRELLSTIGD